jgi:antitoxin ParD1/3/4
VRTNIDIDDELMAAAMEAGGFKTKKEAVEEGLRLVRRRKVYDGLLALRGKLHWDDSDEGWAQQAREEDAPSLTVQESVVSYATPGKAASAAKTQTAKPGKASSRGRGKRS